MVIQRLDIIDKLNRVDWDFGGSSTLQSSVHSLHWYPGNILPQIPNYLISLLSKRGDLIFDPFCGSGTIGLEALQLGRKAWQSDICKASILIARGKLACLSQSIIVGELEEVFHSLFYESSCFSTKDGLNQEGSNEELKYWFNEVTRGQLRHIWSLIENQSEKPIQDVLKMLFTDTLFACCSTFSSKTSSGKKRRHHWGWVADNVRPKKLFQHNAIELFKNRLLQAIQITTLVNENKRYTSNTADDHSVLLVEDARASSIPPASVDLVVTSPPFLAMTDYTLANRITYLWMGWPIEKDFVREIGARRRRNRKYAEQEYIEEMTNAWGQIHKALKPDGICTIFVGASRKFPNVIHSLIEKISSSGFKLLWGPRARRLIRRRVSDRSGTESKEYICVWSKN